MGGVADADLLAAFTISNEKKKHTEIALAALPVRDWVVFAIKTFWGIATFAVPLAAVLWMGNSSHITHLNTDMNMSNTFLILEGLRYTQ